MKVLESHYGHEKREITQEESTRFPEAALSLLNKSYDASLNSNKETETSVFYSSISFCIVRYRKTMLIRKKRNLHTSEEIYNSQKVKFYNSQSLDIPTARHFLKRQY